MHLRGCSSSHFILTVQDCVMKRVHNTDSRGRPGLKFKNLEDIYKSADDERTHFPFAERKTRTRSGFIEEDEPDCQSNEIGLEEMTLSQLRKKCKRKKRKASESVLLTPKVEDDDPDLIEPLCNFRFKVSKRSPTKTMPTNESSLISPIKDHATVSVKDTILMDDDSSKCNPSTESIASESRFAVLTHESCGFNEGPVYNSDSVEDMTDVILPMQVSEMDEEEYVCHPLSVVSSLEDDFSVEYSNTNRSDCFHSQLTPEQVGAQDLESTIDDDDDECCVDLGQSSDLYMVESETSEHGFSTPMPDYLCLPWKSHSWASSNEHDVDDHDVDEHDVDDHGVVDHDVDEHDVDVPANADLEVKLFEHNHQTYILNEASEVKNSLCVETRFPERRKAISPKSQEKLFLAMKYAELSDDVDFYKCKEKLNFEEQNENEFSSTTSDIKDNESNLQPHQATILSQKKAFTSSKQLLKRPKNYKKGSPPKSVPKGCLDGPRLCRSLPRVSTGCTSIQRCSESAIAFSERQMHDIESLASKLMSELNSMKAIVENKLLYESYRARPLNNEIDEVKSAIKTATKTEETARKWLSMMARDCNRFCKIMKLNQDDNPSVSTDPTFGTTNQDKSRSPPFKKERKKISFADEAGGMLCDIKVFYIDNNHDSLELNEKP